MSRQLQADAGLLLVSLVWGYTFVMVKAALDHVGPLTFLALRFALASGVMIILFQRRLRDIGRRELAAGALIGLFLFGGFAFQTAGLQLTSVSRTGFITGMYVVIVPLAAWVWLRRSPGWGSVAGVFLATTGLSLLTLQPGERLAIRRGDLLVLLGAISFALHITSIGVFAPKMDPFALATIQITTTAVMASAMAIPLEWPAWPMDQSVWYSAAFTALAATCGAFGIQTVAQVFTTPTHTALIFSTEPVFAALFGVLLAHDSLQPQAWLGCGLILAGIIVAELRPRQDPTPPTAFTGPGLDPTMSD